MEQVQRVVNEPTVYNKSVIDEKLVEVHKLMAKSVSQSGYKSIAVIYEKTTMILIPHDYDISSELASLFWKKALHYEQQTLPFVNIFYDSLIKAREEGLLERDYPTGIDKSEVIAVFAAKYDPNLKNFNKNTSVMQNRFSFNKQKKKRCDTGLYQYCDFAVLIVQNGTILDYAVHGYVSSINGAIQKHQPKKILYNADLNDPLDVFMKYKHQPFFSATNGKLCPTKIQRMDFVTTPFCKRFDTCCALCNALKDYKGLLFQLPEHTFSPRQFYPPPAGKNKFNQPIHNTRRLKGYTPKKYGTFNKKPSYDLYYQPY